MPNTRYVRATSNAPGAASTTNDGEDGVSVAPDMSGARIWFVPFGGKHSPKEVGEGLNHAAGFLRGEIGRALQLRHAPRLEFIYDTQIEHADKLTRLIDGAVKTDQRDDESKDDSKRNS